MFNYSTIFFSFQKKNDFNSSRLFDTRENDLFFVWENNRLMIYLFPGENKFIQQAIVYRCEKENAFFILFNFSYS